MNPTELYKSGQLDAAIASLNEELRTSPTDMGRRTLLFELLAFSGNLDRADKQLEVIAQQNVEAAWPAQVYQNLLAGERARRALFERGQAPQNLLDPPPYLRHFLEATNRLRENRPAEASAELARGEEHRPIRSGTINDTPFDDLRDCDDVVAAVLELIVQREYVWLPWEQIEELELFAPERPRDLVWTPVRIVLVGGQERRGYVPAIYCGTHTHSDDQLRLGRATDWKQAPQGPVQGIGQRMLLAGEEAWSLLEVRNIRFDPPAAE